MFNNEINLTELQRNIRRFQNQRAAGPDCIPIFWWKQLIETHYCLMTAYNEMVKNVEPIPDCIVESRTFLILKSIETENSKKYRPVTCLSTIYKLLTGILANKIIQTLRDECLKNKKMLQKSFGCKDQLLYSKALLKNCEKNKRLLYVIWIDCQKDFDSIPHSWLLDAIKLKGIADEINGFCNPLMATWKPIFNYQLKTDLSPQKYYR